MELLFGNNDERTTIAHPNSVEQLYSYIKEKLESINYVSHYKRFLFEKNHIVVDYGCHFNFFFIYESTDEKLNQLKGELLH